MSMHCACLFSLCLLLAACGGAEPEGPSVDATRYVTVESGACVEDALTGLLWEVKTDAAGLHDWRNTYTWFNPTQDNKELDYRGVPDGGECSGSGCDTWEFFRAVNEAGHCGFHDWRLPSRNELMSISDLRTANEPPTADLEYFPHMQADEYWTGFDYATQYQSAWAWNYLYGHDRVDWKKSAKFVRLVRGTAGNLDKVKE